MKLAATIGLLCYYSFGIFCLPLSNFSRIGELPNIYQHYKTKDPDPDLADFVAEHFLNLENIIGHFDYDQDRDEDKKEIPHQRYHFSIHKLQAFYTINITETIQPHSAILIMTNYYQHDDKYLPKSSLKEIFHPPITV